MFIFEWKSSLEKRNEIYEVKNISSFFFSEALFLVKFIGTLKRFSSDKLTSFFLKFYILPA